MERLKVALPLWRDPDLTVKEISKRCGLSAHTLYDYLPPRFTKNAHLPLRSEARDEQKKGKKHA